MWIVNENCELISEVEFKTSTRLSTTTKSRLDQDRFTIHAILGDICEILGLQKHRHSQANLTSGFVSGSYRFFSVQSIEVILELMFLWIWCDFSAQWEFSLVHLLDRSKVTRFELAINQSMFSRSHDIRLVSSDRFEDFKVPNIRISIRSLDFELRPC